MNFAIACVTSILCMLGTTSLMEQNKTEKLSLIQSGGGKRIYEATATP